MYQQINTTFWRRMIAFARAIFGTLFVLYWWEPGFIEATKNGSKIAPFIGFLLFAAYLIFVTWDNSKKIEAGRSGNFEKL